MEDVFKFLFVAGVIIFSIVKQARKEAKKNADNAPDMSMPDEATPLPENWGEGTYGGYIPEGPKAEAIPVEEAPVRPKRRKKHSPKPFIPPRNIDSASHRSTSSSFQNASPPDNSSLENVPTPNADFDIRSIEEVRKAIIWSEILQRKYQ